MRFMRTKTQLPLIAVFLSFIAFSFIFPIDSAQAQSGMGSGMSGMGSGMRPGGMRPGGMRPEGMRPEGMRPEGMRPEGMRPEGIETNNGVETTEDLED